MAARAHAASTAHYLIIYAALVALTLLSFGISRLDLGAADFVLALVIASAKTMLVLLFFMHLTEQRATPAFVMASAAFFVVLIVALTAADVATRRTFPPAPAPPAARGGAPAVPALGR